MDISTVLGTSKYLKAADLQGHSAIATIRCVVMEKIESQNGPDETKPVMYFHNKEKALVVNTTNGNAMIAFLGAETDLWVGKNIELYPEQTSFAGKPCLGLRVRQPTTPGLSTTPDAPHVMTAEVKQPVQAPPNDEVPF